MPAIEHCNGCERPTTEPLYHPDEGDAYCGRCVAVLLRAEVERLRAEADDAYRSLHAGRVAEAMEHLRRTRDAR